ncbi:melanoma antigen preferentially expressed in tumors-like [Perognathus longimembris pacificus]|uniref:melanoma antigen preferentially expressed in tumors-like n=1 Tax=Perognathus longimembris pacificus TaxID=214514 RepID=UPI002018EB0E|nr:melanoma antigen preferentially expressed in tumors-like [Perognathus longimembris pacificus]
MELFPSLFTAAYAGRHNEVLKAIVQAWPFACLPLGTLMKEWQPHQEAFQAVLRGLDTLLTQEVRPRKWKLQVLDLRQKTPQDLETLWTRTRDGLCLLPEAAQPLMKKQKVGDSGRGVKQPLAPVQVLIDLYLNKGSHDELLTSLIEKVKQRKGLLYLSCKKLRIFEVPLQNIKMILKMVQLDSVQDLEVSFTWKLPILGKFASHLGQMHNLRRLILSHIQISPGTSSEDEEQCVNQLSTQFLCLHHLQELHLESLFFLQGRLHNVLRCLVSPLKILSVTSCLLLESDLMNLSQCPNTRQLMELNLNRVSLSNVISESIGALLKSVSATLQNLSLNECGIIDSQLTAILPSIRQCSQLTVFTFSGNPVSMSVLESLPHHTIGLTKLRRVRYPAPRESYENADDINHLGMLAHLQARLMQVLRELGHNNVEWLGANSCPHCDWPLYDP